MFNMFDRRRTGVIDYMEFYKSLRVDLNEFRRDLLERVFIILDTDDDGLVDMKDLKTNFNSSRHPDVMQGRKSAGTIQIEFIESFEEHHILYQKCYGVQNQKHD